MRGAEFSLQRTTCYRGRMKSATSPLWGYAPHPCGCETSEIGLPDGPRELLVRAGFFRPSLDGGLPLLLLLRPRPSVSGWGDNLHQVPADRR
jgi:hypothetical protein